MIRTRPSASPVEIMNIAIITVAVMIPVFIMRPYIARPFVHPHLLSAPYVWPTGCSGPSGVQSEIPAACMVDQYYFPDAEKFNFPQMGGVPHWGRRYYRVDNDAINFLCFSDGRCHATNIVRDVFIVPQSSPQQQNGLPVARMRTLP